MQFLQELNNRNNMTFNTISLDNVAVDERTGLIMKKEVCEFCGGTGEYEIESYVYANEPHRAYLGETRVCICQLEN